MDPLIWVIDDDSSIRFVFDRALEVNSIKHQLFSDGESALAALETTVPDVIVSDIKMPGIDGISLIDRVHAKDPTVPVIIMTAHSDLTAAVDSYEKGTFEYLPKPFDIEQAISLVRRAAVHHFNLVRRRDAPPVTEELHESGDAEIIGKSPAMQEVFKFIGRVSRTDVPVLIHGETGTGRELVAIAGLTRELDERGINVELVADEWCNTLEDIKLFADNKAGHMVQIKTPDLGGINNTIEAVLYCKEKGIIAVNTPKSSAIAVAELAFALMISVPCHIPYYDSTMKKGEWQKSVKRTELYGKRLCLLGMGNIARKVAERAKAFGMDVVAYDKYVESSDLAKMMSLEEAVAEADYISMHLPYTPETDRMVNADLIAKMTHHPVIINTGRGKCVDEAAVAEALRSGALSWFCTDVYSSEPPADNPLLACENVTLTPHVGANTTENLLRIGEEVFETIGKLKEEGRI